MRDSAFAFKALSSSLLPFSRRNRAMSMIKRIEVAFYYLETNNVTIPIWVCLVKGGSCITRWVVEKEKREARKPT